MPTATFSGIKAIILDIEGTVAPITFVKDTLFPYALRVLPDYVAKNWSSPSFEPTLNSFPAEDLASPEALVAHVHDLTARDVKVAYLKSLQGTLWRSGYESGALVTPLYDDVVTRIQSWKDRGKILAIFSSGSVEAQKMFFAHVGGEDGEEQHDLTGLFEPYWFDTVNAGAKFEGKSYEKIVSEMGVERGDALFLSDHIKGSCLIISPQLWYSFDEFKEVQAALSAGLCAALVIRPGNPPQDFAEGTVAVRSLGEVELD
ncbi:2,3-diketo-5-methylthio-1-phosphopentane phosphatase [Rhizodiscina lignyota]|uniref:2,3-diketo-5-methylthio-1-phosphopentane phosphatase n=1 Tax=Rhizodiscina lignyota TaxID=1504668 RepID=A0A9P4M5I4_9PEZI|nr:2,3-diketo-5-methylthio-1-phosphopentane phosphatase [Rhizodiscina lignyota]